MSAFVNGDNKSNHPNNKIIGGSACFSEPATDKRSVILGGTDHFLSNGVGLNHVIVGGNANTDNSSTDDSAIIAGSENILSGTSSKSCLLGGGSSNIISSDAATIIGGSTNQITSAVNGGIFQGTDNQVNGAHAIVLGGAQNLAGNSYNVLTGLWGEGTRYNEFVRGGNRITNRGDNQMCYCRLYATSTTNTPVEMLLDLATTQRVSFTGDATFDISIRIVARRYGTNEYASFWRRALVSKNGTSTALVGSVQTIGTDIISAGTYTVAITVEDSDDTLRVNVNGDTGYTVKWAAEVEINTVKHTP